MLVSQVGPEWACATCGCERHETSCTYNSKTTKGEIFCDGCFKMEVRISHIPIKMTRYTLRHTARLTQAPERTTCHSCGKTASQVSMWCKSRLVEDALLCQPCSKKEVRVRMSHEHPAH